MNNNNNYEMLNLYNDEWEIVNGILCKYHLKWGKEIDRLRIPDGVTEIDEDAFEFARVKSIVIPKSVHTIRVCAFRDSYIQAIYIENPEIYLERGCFYQLENLNKVVIGKRRFEVIVTQFDSDTCGDDAYCLERYVGEAQEYYVDDDIKVIAGGAFCNCETLEKVVLGKSVEEIEMYAFSSDSDKCSLRQVVLPDSLRIIGICAFAGCNSIDEIKIPQSVEIIEKEAFRDWESWQKIYMPLRFKKVWGVQKWRKDCEAEIIYY
ncbi:MAG: leucine-rich repeat domain-containing protein [Clostridia bacterium]|nr:leucine-rich repeat domain-containing protein [Clostridia bacterium]